MSSTSRDNGTPEVGEGGGRKRDEGGGGARKKLVYVEAVCREIMRWLVVTPLGVPHAAVRDDVYEGVFVPKGGLSSSGSSTPFFGFGDY